MSDRPRLTDDPRSILGEDLRALGAHSPKTVDVDAGMARLAAAIGASGAGGPLDAPAPDAAATGMGTAPVAASTAAAAAHTVGVPLAAKVAVVAAAIAGGAGAGAWILTRPSPVPVEKPRVEQPATVGRPQITAPAPREPEAPPSTEAPQRTPSPPARRQHRTRAIVPSGPVDRAPAAHDPLLAEAALIARARAALDADPATTLALVGEARAAFGDGALVEEREALAVFARARLHGAGAAAADAGRFLARFPRGPFTEKMSAIARARATAP